MSTLKDSTCLDSKKDGIGGRRMNGTWTESKRGRRERGDVSKGGHGGRSTKDLPGDAIWKGVSVM